MTDERTTESPCLAETDGQRKIFHSMCTADQECPCLADETGPDIHETYERYEMEIGRDAVWIMDTEKMNPADQIVRIYRGPARLLAATGCLEKLRAGERDRLAEMSDPKRTLQTLFAESREIERRALDTLADAAKLFESVTARLLSATEKLQNALEVVGDTPDISEPVTDSSAGPYKVGDLVRLKSGGSARIVTCVDQERGEQRIRVHGAYGWHLATDLELVSRQDPLASGQQSKADEPRQFKVGDRVYPKGGGQGVNVTAVARVVNSKPYGRQQFRADRGGKWLMSDDYRYPGELRGGFPSVGSREVADLAVENGAPHPFE